MSIAFPLLIAASKIADLFNARPLGAEVSVHEVPAISHRTTVIIGLWKGPQLVRMVRAAQPI
jgi:hypothetical protein